MKKVLLIASNGGHFVQASRLLPAFEGTNLTVVSTSKENPSLIDTKYYRVKDCNMKQYISCFICFLQCVYIFAIVRPNVVVSTGAAPGLLMILLAKFTTAKAIWIDSIANTKNLSIAGTYAKRLTTYCYSQWQDVAEKHGVKYMGAVI